MAEQAELRRLTREVAPGTLLIKEGEASTALVILIQGRLGVYRGASRVAQIQEPGSYFGESSVFSGEPHSATVRAETEATIVCLDARAASAFLHSPEAEARMVRNLADRLRATTDKLLRRDETISAHRETLGQVLRQLADLYGAVLQEDDADQARLRTLNTLRHLIRKMGRSAWTDERVEVD